MSADGMHGPRWTKDGVEFRVWAPKLERLSVRVDGQEHPLTRTPGGSFFGWVRDAQEGARYAFVLPDGSARPDPASLRQPSGVHADSALFQTDRYAWRDESWKGLPLDQLSFYELHVGTFTREGTLAAAQERLSELRELGVTCVELMPVQPFAGERNWGYDGVLLHAVHEAYGGPEGLQRFVDAAHAHGLAVCMDVVFNHLGPEGNYLGEFGPYFTSRHRSPWGDGLNYDGPDGKPVRAYMVEAATQWVRDFHVDALRLDAVHAIVDDSQPHVAAEISAAVRELSRVTGRLAHVIAESDLNDRKVVEPPPKGWDADSMWADDFHHALHTLLTGERDHFFADYGERKHLIRALEEGFVYQGDFSKFRQRLHGTSTRGLTPKQFVIAAQNHDQVGNRALGERLSHLLPPAALHAVAALTVLGSGLPLIFMGEEFGSKEPFLYFTSHTDPGLGKAVSEGRAREFAALAGKEVPDPQEKTTFERSMLSTLPDLSADQRALRETYRRLFAIRREHAAVLGETWPKVHFEHKVIVVDRSVFTLKVNLSPEPSEGLGPWEWRI